MNKKILIIDDSKTSLLLFESVFSGTGIDVFSEIDSNVAIQKIKSIQPDLIVLDLMMPDIDGFHLLEIIKKDQDICNIPVIILSAIHESNSIKKALQSGADKYIKKPMNVNEVLTAVNDLLGS